MKININVEIEGKDAEDFVTALALKLGVNGLKTTTKPSARKKQKKSKAPKATKKSKVKKSKGPKTDETLSPAFSKALAKHMKKTASKSGRKPRVPDNTFCEIWQTSSTLNQASKRLGMTTYAAAARAEVLATKWKLPLKSL
ncbi:MAG: hypothetical protein CMB45_04965 [Euryarchaeota archaeon]|nr:hypothetical protein [Euryarchaeota archaeon]|tara:strand:+ start:2296 stop:2718 length:423 start_codon:yes stop_codon:yes gene_type:complete